MIRSKYLVIIVSAIFSVRVAGQDNAIFPKGEISTVNNHTGTVWLNELATPDSVFNYGIAMATFAAGAKLDWHAHPAGQILLITAGVGYYQERGKPIRIVRKGDIIKCPPGVEHWHGASPDSSFAYIATTPAQKGKTIWLQRVTDTQYHSRWSNAQTQTSDTGQQQDVINLSKAKWLWMADKKVDTLDSLFDDKAVFVHMGGSWGKSRELDGRTANGRWARSRSRICSGQLK